MDPPPGKLLFYGTLYHDAMGSAGVTLDSHRNFTAAHLPEYHPLSDMFDDHTKQRVIQAHRRLKYLFQSVPTHSALHWPWRLISSLDTVSPITQLLIQISRIPGSARHDGFTLNVLARLHPPWTHTAQRLIHHSLVHRILPHMTKDHTKVPIPKEGDSFSSRSISLNHNWEAFITGWISDKMSEGLESANTLPSYITVYRKDKSIDDLTLNHIMFLEDTRQFLHDISAVLSDNIEKFSTVSPLRPKLSQCISMAVHVMGTLNWLPRQGTTPWHSSQRSMHTLPSWFSLA